MADKIVVSSSGISEVSFTPDELSQREIDNQNAETRNEEQESIKKIQTLKQNLSSTDYQAIKYTEGWIAAEEYAPIKAQRQSWREEINRLEVQE